MSPEVWNKVLRFIKRTGDRAILADSEMNEIFVITTLSDYEQKVFSKSAVKELTEEQLLDRINQDIAVWQSSQAGEITNLNNIDDDQKQEDLETENESDDEERYYVEPSE